MSKRLLVAALLASSALGASPPAEALPPSQWCERVEQADLFIGRNGIGTREEPGFDCVLVLFVRGIETGTVQMSDEVQRARLVLGPQHHPRIEEQQDVVVKNQMGCCVEVDANGWLLTLERTGLFGDEYTLTLFVDGHKVVICPWTAEDGPDLLDCKIHPPLP